MAFSLDFPQARVNTGGKWQMFVRYIKDSKRKIKISRYLTLCSVVCEGQDSSVGIVTRYGPDGPEIESRWGEIFRTCPDRPWGPHSLLYNGYRVFPEGRVRPGRDADPSPPPSAEVKNRVELYLYSP